MEVAETGCSGDGLVSFPAAALEQDALVTFVKRFPGWQENSVQLAFEKEADSVRQSSLKWGLKPGELIKLKRELEGIYQAIKVLEASDLTGVTSAVLDADKPC